MKIGTSPYCRWCKVRYEKHLNTFCLNVKNWTDTDFFTSVIVSLVKGGEIIWVHVGQAGIQIGEELWSLFAEDHDIGGVNETPSAAAYYILNKEKPVPRNILLDTEPSTIYDTLRRKARNRSLFPGRQIVSGVRGSGGIYPRGYRSRELEKAEDTVRLLLEEAGGFCGLAFIYGAGGGTGSGMTSNLATIYGQTTQVHFAVSPNPALRAQSTSSVEAYNVGLMASDLMNSKACTIMVDNDALYNIAEKKGCFSRPDYPWINHLLSQAIGTASSGWRFPSAPSVRFDDLPTNLIPFPSAKYSTMSFAPLFNPLAAEQELFLSGDLTRELLETRSFLACVDPRLGSFAAAIVYRGPVSAVEVSQTLNQQIDRGGIRFLPWIKPSFKIGITRKKPPRIRNVEIAKSACMVANTAGLKPTWDQIHYQFRKMLRKRAFLHWYLQEGAAHADFLQAENDILDIIDTYAG